MGQVTSSDCVDLAELPAEVSAKLFGDTYTAVRTDGHEETGWKIENRSHSSACGIPSWIKAHATNKYGSRDGTKGWKFFMNNGFCCDILEEEGVEKKEHVCRVHGCGWRSCDITTGRCTFWPTRLETAEERREWWTWLHAQVETLNYRVVPLRSP